MAPIALWTGNLRLSLVLVPVRLFPAVSTEDAVAFRMIHKESGEPIRYVKGIETEQGFKEVPEEEIIKGYEHAKGQHVLIKPEELDELKLEAKHTIDMARFVSRDEIDSRYFEKPYYLLPDGDEAYEGYTVLRDALAKTNKIAVGQLIMHGREHLVGITAQGKGLMLVILRYAEELRGAEPYFQKIPTEAKDDAVELAIDLIKEQAGRFEPQKMPNEYAQAVKNLVKAKVEQRAPAVTIEPERREAPQVVNIMDALKKSMQAKGQTKVNEAVRNRMGKAAPAELPPHHRHGRAARPGEQRTRSFTPRRHQ
jgi:DNA end-binding protein Ku